MIYHKTMPRLLLKAFQINAQLFYFNIIEFCIHHDKIYMLHYRFIKSSYEKFCERSVKFNTFTDVDKKMCTHNVKNYDGGKYK